MSDESARNFWNRVEKKTQGMTLKSLCETAGLNYNSIRNRKSGPVYSLPRLESAVIIAQTLNTTVEYLLTGQEQEKYSSFDKELVRAYYEHPEHQESINTLLGLKRDTGWNFRGAYTGMRAVDS